MTGLTAMITKTQLADAMAKECDICIHLHSKLTPAAASYRPTDGQRSTVELLRYLAICGIAGVTCMKDRDWKQFAGFTARVKDMTIAEFPAAMARQRDELKALLGSISDQSLINDEAQLPGGGTVPLGLAIISGPFKWLAAYKLQLFLYAKASGASEIGTVNAWAGVDRR